MPLTGPHTCWTTVMTGSHKPHAGPCTTSDVSVNLVSGAEVKLNVSHCRNHEEIRQQVRLATQIPDALLQLVWKHACCTVICDTSGLWPYYNNFHHLLGIPDGCCLCCADILCCADMPYPYTWVCDFCHLEAENCCRLCRIDCEQRYTTKLFGKEMVRTCRVCALCIIWNEDIIVEGSYERTARLQMLQHAYDHVKAMEEEQRG